MNTHLTYIPSREQLRRPPDGALISILQADLHELKENKNKRQDNFLLDGSLL